MEARVLYVLMMMLLCSSSQFSPPPKMALPVEGNSYEILTPAPPLFLPETASCSGIKCNEGQECLIKMGTSGFLPAQCYPIADKCNDVSACRLVCPFGLRKDFRNCDLCACYNPCQEVKCENGKECIAEKVLGKSVGVCKVKSDCLEIACDLNCQWGLSKDYFNCSICACFDPCLAVTCAGGKQCQRKYDVALAAFKGYCPPAEECYSETCSRWCVSKGVTKDPKAAVDCSHCDCARPCMNLQCGVEEVCVLESKDFCVEGDMCFRYKQPQCQKAPTLCALPKCENECPFGRENERNNCPSCRCLPPCQKCKDDEHCAMTSDQPPKFSCQACKTLKCPNSCQNSFEKDQWGCPTCECQKDFCSSDTCADNQKCVLTYTENPSLSKYLCIDKKDNACTAVLDYLRSKREVTENSWQMQCSPKGAFKAVQLLNGKITCVHADGQVMQQDNNCYKQGLLLVPVHYKISGNEINLKMRLTETLAEEFMLREEDVVVSKISACSTEQAKMYGSSLRADVILLSNQNISQQLLVNLMKLRKDSNRLRLTTHTPYPALCPPTDFSRYFDIAPEWIIYVLISMLIGFIIILLMVFATKLFQRFKSKNEANKNFNNEKDNKSQYKENLASVVNESAFAPYKHLDEAVDV